MRPNPPDLPNEGVSGTDAELRGSASERPNLAGRKPHLLKQERATVSLDGVDVDENRFTGRIEYGLIESVQIRAQPATEGEGRLRSFAASYSFR